MTNQERTIIYEYAGLTCVGIDEDNLPIFDGNIGSWMRAEELSEQFENKEFTIEDLNN